MGGRRNYTRWDYDDETEITMEEQLTLEENLENSSMGGGTLSTSASATFPPPNVLVSSSPIRSRESGKRSRKTSIKEKVQLFSISGGILLIGFTVGFWIGSKDIGRPAEVTSSHSTKHHHSSTADSSSSSHEHNEPIFHELVNQISAVNIRNNLKRMSQEEHRAGTPEGRSMAIAIRDLWRSYGISVRVEQHKTLLTKTMSFNFVEVIDQNGTVVFTTSKIGDDVNLPNSRPIVAFSSAADLNGTLVYGHYGGLEDFQKLRKSQLILNGSIALIRFGSLHPSNVAANAVAFGIRGLIFYPDPQDFGPALPSIAIRRASLLTVGQVHDYQKHKGNWSIPAHTISYKDAEQLFGEMEGSDKAPQEWEGGLKSIYWLGGSRSTGYGNFDANNANSKNDKLPKGRRRVRLRIFNEAKTSSIYNVVAAIPGAMESDRYVIVGCSHDSWAGAGAGDPGVGLAMTTEILRAFSASLTTGWKPRRSIMFVSWDANLFASSGVSHWLQEHHFEISNRAIAYIDMTRLLQGNQSLHVFSSPLFKETARKAINRIKHLTASGPSPPTSSSSFKEQSKKLELFSNVQWKSVVSNDEPAFAFLGNLGIPNIRICVSNSPKDYNYPLYHTAFDTFENFAKFADPDLRWAEMLGRINAEVVLLLADTSALPITLNDYVKDIRKEFDHFMAEYHDDFSKGNLSYVGLQAAVMRLEVISENFRTQSKNHTMKGEAHLPQFPISHRKLRREMHHRILNDKLISVEKALLTRNADSDGYKHQVIGYTRGLTFPTFSPAVDVTPGVFGHKIRSKPDEIVSNSVNISTSSSSINENTTSKHSTSSDLATTPTATFPAAFSSSSQHEGQSLSTAFPKLRAVLDCGRNCEAGISRGDVCTDFYLFSTVIQGQQGMTSESNNASILISSGSGSNGSGKRGKFGGKGVSSSYCGDWKAVASQRITSLVRSLDAVSAIIQSPLVAQPHE